MAHKLDEVLAFFEKFGGDNFKRFDGTVHNMAKYATILKEFIKVETQVVKMAAAETKELVKETVKAVEAVAATPKVELPKPEVK